MSTIANWKEPVPWASQGARVWRALALSPEARRGALWGTLAQDAPAAPGAARAPRNTKNAHEAPDFTIELVASDGRVVDAPASRFADIPPPLKEKFTKFAFVEQDRYGRDWEPVFQTIRAPLSAFTSQAGRAFDPQKLVALRLKFDRTASSVICISAIGFGSE